VGDYQQDINFNIVIFSIS